jgi:prophage regulatory protein
MLETSSLRLLNSADLYKLGIRYSRGHLPRLEKTGKFPRRIKLTPNGAVGWVQSEIHDWLKDRIKQSRTPDDPTDSVSPAPASEDPHVPSR